MPLKPEDISAIEARANATQCAGKADCTVEQWAAFYNFLGGAKNDVPALLAHIREQEKLAFEHAQNMADMVVKLEAAQKQAEWLSKAHDELTDIFHNERQARDERIAELEAELDQDRLSQLLADALEERYKLNAEILAQAARIAELEADIDHIHEYIKQNAPFQVEAWGKNTCACAAHRMRMQDLRITELETEINKFKGNLDWRDFDEFVAHLKRKFRKDYPNKPEHEIDNYIDFCAMNGRIWAYYAVAKLEAENKRLSEALPPPMGIAWTNQEGGQP